jgi:hypothetical protein
VLSRPAAQVFIISGALTPPAMASRARLIAEDLHAVNGSQKLLQSAPRTALRNGRGRQASNIGYQIYNVRG